jgi:hypothetical protein
MFDVCSNAPMHKNLSMTSTIGSLPVASIVVPHAPLARSTLSLHRR